MTGRQRDEVEARADAIMADMYAAQAYAAHVEAQMRAGDFEVPAFGGPARRLLGALRILRREGVAFLAVILVLCAFLGYAAVTARPALVMAGDANGVAAVNTGSGRVAPVSLSAAPGSINAADASVRVPPLLRPLSPGSRIWMGIRRTAVTPDGVTGARFRGFPRS